MSHAQTIDKNFDSIYDADGELTPTANYNNIRLPCQCYT